MGFHKVEKTLPEKIRKSLLSPGNRRLLPGGLNRRFSSGFRLERRFRSLGFCADLVLVLLVQSTYRVKEHEEHDRRLPVVHIRKRPENRDERKVQQIRIERRLSHGAYRLDAENPGEPALRRRKAHHQKPVDKDRYAVMADKLPVNALGMKREHAHIQQEQKSRLDESIEVILLDAVKLAFLIKAEQHHSPEIFEHPHEREHVEEAIARIVISEVPKHGKHAPTLLTRGVLRYFLWGGGGSRRSGKNNGGAGIIVVVIVAIVCAAIAYFLTLLTRFAISRKREFMADAGGAELTRNPRALASALRKISANPGLGHVNREDVAQLFIIHPKKLKQGFLDSLTSMFSSHPNTQERIRILEQF